MPRNDKPKSSSKGKSQDMNWEDWANPLCVAEPGWEEEPKKSWDCTTCKKYVKMTHLSKMWSRERAEKQVRRWEGQISTCLSKHFVHRYEEVTRSAELRDSKPNVMNYSNMAMVWAEIVLHKDVDWRTIYGKNVHQLHRTDAVIYTSWIGISDCMPEWSNRGQLGYAPVVLPDAEDDWEEETEEEDTSTPVTFGETHGRKQEREEIQFQQEMRDAMQRSLEDRGRPHGHHGSYQHDHGVYGTQNRRSDSHYSNDPRGGYGNYQGSQGTTHGYGSNQGSSQYYPGFSGGSSYNDTRQRGSENDDSIPPPTFGGPYYGNYGHGGASSGTGDVWGGGPFLGTFGSGSTGPTRKDDTDSESE